MLEFLEKADSLTSSMKSWESHGDIGPLSKLASMLIAFRHMKPKNLGLNQKSLFGYTDI